MRTSVRLGGIAWVVGLSLLGAAIRGAEPSEGEREEHLRRMRELAGSIRLLADPQKGDSEVKLVETPILRYSDGTRDSQDSSLWIWSSGGRPAALLAVELYPKPPRGPRWLFEIASLSTERIGARHATDLVWNAKEPGLVFQKLEGAEAPAEKPVRRLTQIKDLHRRFGAHEQTVNEGRIELRPLSSPLLRYTDRAQGVLDGAILAFANGTNPEVLIVLEARESGTWQYALVQMSGAEVIAELDGRVVWQRGEADPPAVRGSYVNGWMSASVKDPESR